MEHPRPFVTLSYAQSADGRIATRDGRAERISGPESLQFTHTLRRDNQAIMVGIGTVIADDPLLTCRLHQECPSPVRIILDTWLRLPLHSQIAVTAESYQTIVFCSAEVSVKRISELEKLSINVVPIAATHIVEDRIALSHVLSQLGKMGFTNLFVEGGSAIITSFLSEKLVDRLCIILAPTIIGNGINAVGDLGVESIQDARQGYTQALHQAGNDIIWDIVFEAAPQSRKYARAVYFTKPFTVEITKEEIQPRSGELLIQSRCMAISHGTEGHLYRNTFPSGESRDQLNALANEMKYPLKYGYMNAGTTPSGERVFAFYPHQDTFYFPQKELIYFPKSVSFEDIVLYPSVETAFTIVMDTAPLPGERILLIGQGMIGLLISEILIDYPGIHLAALEVDPYRRELSTKLGLTAVDLSQLTKQNLRESVHQLFHGHFPDKIIDVSGSEKGLQMAIDSAGFETHIIEASWHGSLPVTIRLGEEFHRKRLTISSSQVSTLSSQLNSRWDKSRRTEEVKRWINSIKPSKYVTHRFSLSQVKEAYQMIFGESSAGAAQPLVQALLMPDATVNFPENQNK